MQPIERNEIFDLAFRFVTETSENIFLTGKAGTGKTTFLKYLRDHAAKNIIVAAPTGVAAINAGGVTLHSLFQLPFHPFLPTRQSRDELLSKIRINKQRQQLLRKMELLIIDEVSMVRCDVMDAIDAILRSVRRNHQAPFGGVQLLCIGDLYQLPPVAQNAEWSILSEYYASPFFFDSLSVKEQAPLLIELEKIYRQKEDGFVRLLNKVRNNQMSGDDFEDLHLRFNPGFVAPTEENYITLTSHNNQADQINQLQLHKLHASAFTYPAVIKDEFPENMYPAEASLVLKEGAQVMFLKNDVVRKRYFNGKIGRVKLLETEKIIVECDGEEIEVGLETWENTRYTLNRSDGKLQQETLGSFTQYPLRLAWAITIHKSQGLTFDKVMIDAGAAFSSGQVYVALSRCTSLEGIVLLSKIPPTAIYSNENIAKGQQSLQYRGSMAERFEGARQIFTLELLEGLFSFRIMNEAAEHLLDAVRQNQQQLNTDALSWTQNYRSRISSLQAVGLQFLNQVNALLKEQAVIEKNEMLQKRIRDAAQHFIPLLKDLISELKNHPLLTEHKESADAVDERFSVLAEALHIGHYFMEYCLGPFTVPGFLKHKLALSVPRFNISAYARGKKQVVTDTLNPELFATLKRWRDMVCEETGLPIYMVANQSALKEICTFLPLNKKDLQLLSGFGKAKAEKYGDDIIDAVAEYCSRNQLETNISAKAGEPKRERKVKTGGVKVDTKSVSFELYKQGKKPAEIAKERNLTIGTIENHLTHFIALGEIELNDLVSQEKQRLVQDAVAIHGNLSHKTLMENLPEGFSYGELKMVLAANRI